jgi:hypothetical protein
MSVKTNVIINQTDITVVNTAILFHTVVTDGSGTTITPYYSDGGTRNIEEWLDYFNTICTDIAAVNYDDYEFCRIKALLGSGVTNLGIVWAPYAAADPNFNVTGSTEDLQSTALMVKIGCVINSAVSSNRVFEYNNPAGGFTITGYLEMNSDIDYATWGTYRLIIQGSESIDSKGVSWISRMLAPERVTGKGNNETFESIGYVVNSYDKRFDLKRWKIPCHWLGTDKEQWVRCFIDEAVNGKNSDIVKLYGDEHWIRSTETWRILADQYGDIDVDVGHALLVKFIIGLREVQ